MSTKIKDDPNAITRLVDPARGMFEVQITDFNTVLGGIHGGMGYVKDGRTMTIPKRYRRTLTQAPTKKTKRMRRADLRLKKRIRDFESEDNMNRKHEHHKPGSRNRHKTMSIKKEQ